jgi:hypothetical protein
MRILGLDICKDHAVGWLLDEQPHHLKNYFRQNLGSRSKDPQKDPQTFYFNQEGIEKLLLLQLNAVILEPTGVHYSWLIAHICQCEGIQVLWVGHSEATYYRKQNKLPDKNDLADGLALAAYGHQNWGKEDFFLWFNPQKISRIRELYLQLKSLNRIQSPIINRSRQQLVREFPEAAFKDSAQGTDGLSPLWAWLGKRERNLKKKNHYYDRLYDKSIAPKYGVKISRFTQRTANFLCEIHLWEKEIEGELRLLLREPEFKAYNKCFNQFGMGLRTRALILSQIYPITRFQTLGSFKRRLGMAGDENSSGDKLGWKHGTGSKMCRSELYLWILTRISPQKSRPNNEIGAKLGNFYDERYGRFQENPELLKQRTPGGTERLSKALKILKGEITRGEPNKSLEELLEALEEIIEPNYRYQKQTGGTKPKFGNLVISQTAAYAIRLLFRELKRATVNR